MSEMIAFPAPAQMAASNSIPAGSGNTGAGPRPAAAPSIAVIVNARSGLNSRDAAAVDRAMAVFGGAARRIDWDPEDNLEDLVAAACRDGSRSIVSAGGDGTAMAVAAATARTDCAFAALPLGTFNFYSRGLGLPDDPAEAARAILGARPHRIAVGTVNGRIFLNNASLGLYPQVLREREAIYARFGRRRLMAHWSVIRTFLRFQRPMRLELEIDGHRRRVRTPLLFVARSAYQLGLFGLDGAEAIAQDRFAVLIGRGETRMDLFRTAWRLVTGTAVEGRDYDLITPHRLRVHVAGRRALLAYDGEKGLEPEPFDFRMDLAQLTILRPDTSVQTRRVPVQ